MCRFQFLPKVFMLFFCFRNVEILSHRFRKSQYEIMFFSSAASFGCSRDLTPFSLPFYLRRKRDCPFEQSLKRKRETKIVLDKSELILNVEGAHAGIYGCGTQLFFDAEQLVVFRHTLGSAGSTGLDLTGVLCHCQVGNGGILGLTGTMR